MLCNAGVSVYLVVHTTVHSCLVLRKCIIKLRIENDSKNSALNRMWKLCFGKMKKNTSTLIMLLCSQLLWAESPETLSKMSSTFWWVSPFLVLRVMKLPYDPENCNIIRVDVLLMSIDEVGWFYKIRSEFRRRLLLWLNSDQRSWRM